MVFIKDEGSLFDGPPSLVWKYIFSGKDHDANHLTTRKARFKVASKVPFSLVYSAEREFKGRWKREAWRISFFPPLSQLIEMLDGPFAGSKMVYLYTPKGRKTQIDVYGEFKSKRIPPDQLRAAVARLLKSEFDADAPAIQALARKK